MLQIRGLVEYTEEMVKVLDTLEDLYFETDLRGRFVFLNKASKSITGYEREELIGKTYEVIMDKETASLVFQRFNQVFRTGEHVKFFEHDILRKDGNRLTISSSISLVRDETGKKIGFRGIIRDITVQKELTERLRALELWYRTLFDSSATALFVIEPDAVISLVNRQAEVILGYGGDQIVGKLRWMDLVHPKDIPMLMERWKERLRTDDPTIRPYQIRIKTSEGLKWVFMSVGYLPHLRKTIASLIDITDRVRAEEEARYREEAFRLALEASPIPIALYDINLSPLFINRAFEETFGWKLEELRGPDLSSARHIPEELKGEALEIARKLYEKGIITGIHTKRKNKRGELLDVLLNGAAFLDREGKPRGLVTFLMDITEREKIESQLRQLHKLEALGGVTGGVAHDFNNILQAIYGFAQVMLLRKKPEDPDYRRLKAIEESCERARDLIQNLLIFSRKSEPKLKTVNLNRELKQNITVLERLIPKMIKLELNLTDDLYLINADTTQLQQVIINLSVNARDAMPDGGTLTFETKNLYLDEEFCKTHVGFKPGPYVLLSVTDTGVGIPPEIIDKIFDPFFTTKEPGKGTGLGLSTVYGIVKSHGGFINCYSIVGQGTTFKIYLPAALQEDKRVQLKELNSHLPLGKGERILVVDDEENILELFRDTLTKANYKVITARSGEECIGICERVEGKIDLIVMDLNMPGMGGIKCIKELQERNMLKKIMIASGYHLNGELREQLGMKKIVYLTKPFDYPSLLKTIRELLDEA
ncbi:MAG: PAS domain S-box protein [Desulfatiglandales bacterium]